MAQLYANLVMAGLWKLDQVPDLWRPEVEKLINEPTEA